MLITKLSVSLFTGVFLANKADACPQNLEIARGLNLGKFHLSFDEVFFSQFQAILHFSEISLWKVSRIVVRLLHPYITVINSMHMVSLKHLGAKIDEHSTQKYDINGMAIELN